MITPKHVLLIANAITEDELTKINHAMQLAAGTLAIKISAAYVLPELPTCYFSIPSMAFLAEKFYEEARVNLAAIGEILNIKQDDQWLITGRGRPEILRLANKLGVDFILANSAQLQNLHKTFFDMINLSSKPEPIIRDIQQMDSLVHRFPIYPYSIY